MIHHGGFVHNGKIRQPTFFDVNTAVQITVERRFLSSGPQQATEAFFTDERDFLRR